MKSNQSFILTNFHQSEIISTQSFLKRIYYLKEIMGRVLFNKKVGVLDQMFVSPQKSYVEALTPKVMVLGHMAFGK